MRKSNTTVPGDQAADDSGSRNRALSTAAKETYDAALQAGGERRESPMQRFVREDAKRIAEVKASRAASAAAMRQR